MGVVFHGLKENFVSSSLQEEGFLAVNPASDDAEGAALCWLEEKSHRLPLWLEMRSKSSVKGVVSTLQLQVFYGIARYCMVLHVVARCCTVLHSVEWCCMVLHGIAWNKNVTFD